VNNRLLEILDHKRAELAQLDLAEEKAQAGTRPDRATFWRR